MTQAAHPPSSKAFMVAMVAAVLASVGDFGLLYTGQQAGDATLGWPVPPPGTLAISQWLGAFLIPLYGVGYVSLAQGLEGRARPIVYWAGIYTSALGGVIHALTGLAIHHSAIDATESAGAFSVDPSSLPFLLPFVGVVVAGLFVASGFFAAATLQGNSIYPRWLGLMNPMTCVVLIVGVGLPFHYGWLFLVPMAPNVGTVAFFSLVLMASGRERECRTDPPIDV